MSNTKTYNAEQIWNSLEELFLSDVEFDAPQRTLPNLLRVVEDKLSSASTEFADEYFLDDLLPEDEADAINDWLKEHMVAFMIKFDDSASTIIKRPILMAPPTTDSKSLLVEINKLFDRCSHEENTLDGIMPYNDLYEIYRSFNKAIWGGDGCYPEGTRQAVEELNDIFYDYLIPLRLDEVSCTSFSGARLIWSQTNADTNDVEDRINDDYKIFTV